MLVVDTGGVALAEQRVPTGIAALLVGTIPLWFAILARIFMGERLGGRALAGLVLGFAGLALLVDPSGQEGAEPIGAEYYGSLPDEHYLLGAIDLISVKHLELNFGVGGGSALVGKMILGYAF